MMVLMVIMALCPLIRNLSRVRARKASLIDLLASPQVKKMGIAALFMHALQARSVAH